MSDYHSPVYMKKDFSGRGRRKLFGGGLARSIPRGSSRRRLEGMEHGARNIKRGIKETPITYVTRKSSREKLHPSPSKAARRTRPLVHFNDADLASGGPPRLCLKGIEILACGASQVRSPAV